MNILTSSNTDRETHTPAYKETAVQMKSLPYQGPSPLMTSNFRHLPAPLRSVEWK